LITYIDTLLIHSQNEAIKFESFPSTKCGKYNSRKCNHNMQEITPLFQEIVPLHPHLSSTVALPSKVALKYVRSLMFEIGYESNGSNRS
jgi:hypothetical protein